MGAGAVVGVGAMVAGGVGAGSVVVDAGRNMVGTSKEASCVLGAWDVDTRNSPPTSSMMTAAGLVRRSVQRRFMRNTGPQTAATGSFPGECFLLAASEPVRAGRTVCPGRPG